MSATLTLTNLSTAEKLRVMESLWDDLCSSPESVPSPGWHEQVLVQREEAVRQGTASFADWESAKRRLRERAP